MIVREYDERLRAFTFNLLRDRNAMDDVLQEVYLKAYRALPGFRSESRLSTWLLRIAYTTCVSHLRAAGREPLPDSELVEGRGGVSFEELVEGLSLRGQLAAALATLPAELRACLLLVYREGLTYEEAASVLGVAPGTVGWRLHEARKRLAGALEEVQSLV
ncbi:MAG: RNA polymerase sigma factor [Thermoleophilia bacterium]|nr:RNA polymerase sigma factor [Thermoleophilia bacterium]